MGTETEKNQLKGTREVLKLRKIRLCNINISNKMWMKEGKPEEIGSLKPRNLKKQFISKGTNRIFTHKARG